MDVAIVTGNQLVVLLMLAKCRRGLPYCHSDWVLTGGHVSLISLDRGTLVTVSVIGKSLTALS